MFIHGNALEDRLVQLNKQPLVIGECGFGFGLNFLLTCEYFCRLAPVASTLHFISTELHPVLRRDLQRYLSRLPPSLTPYASALLDNYPEQGAGIHRLTLTAGERNIILDLLYGDASESLDALCQPFPLVEAWYLDGFSPAKNTSMWNARLCHSLARLSKPGASLATYSSAGHVRRNLEKAGFEIDRIPGFGNKRHMVTGCFREDALVTPSLSWSFPWREQPLDPVRIAVIGAGLAGCASAHALALKGYAVSLVEKSNSVASGASGNPRAIVHFNPSRRLSPECRFRLNAYNFALRHYTNLSTLADFAWRPADLLQLALTDKEQAFQQDLLQRSLYDPALLQYADKDMSAALSMSFTPAPGLHFPKAGSLDPAALCRAWIKHPNIALLTSHELLDLTYEDNRWCLNLDSNGKKSAEHFDAVVICNSMDAGAFTVIPDYPLVTNHGQTDTFEAGSALQGLNSLLCHEGYAIPWEIQGKAMLTIGGSFEQGRHLEAQSGSLRVKNLALLRTMSPVLFTTLANNKLTSRSRAGTRCSTPDYLPIAGPVENRAACGDIFAGYTRNARKEINARAVLQPGLYINVAQGSSGLTTVPLLAEYIASLISANSLPLNREEIRTIHPLRFMIRNLKKQQ